AKIKSAYIGNCSFASGNSETEWIDFELTEQDLTNMQDPTDSTLYPDDPDAQEPTEPTNPDDNNPSGNVPSSGDEGGSGTLDEILAKLKEIPLWQIIASVISIILIIIFLSKTAGYESKRKKFNKKADKLESSVYAGAFLGLAMTGWTAIACVLMGLAVVSLVIMLIAKSRCNKAEENYEDSLAEHEEKKRQEEKEEARQRDENMRMMFMGMGNNGGMAQGMPQGGYMGGGYVVQQGLGADEIRGIVSETMTALLPSMQQLLPQQASSNDDEIIQKLMERSERNDERIEQLMKNQEALIAKLLEKDAVQQVAATQVVEKVVEVPVEVEKIVEKEVVKEVPVEVEKIVEKEVRVEVPVEKIVEV
ncbi:MAG: hypothetical protein K2N53_00595, partial [Clostridia bacterium]|nr:hypothetical protein [Clostridia bacterium]